MSTTTMETRIYEDIRKLRDAVFECQQTAFALKDEAWALLNEWAESDDGAMKAKTQELFGALLLATSRLNDVGEHELCCAVRCADKVCQLKANPGPL